MTQFDHHSLLVALFFSSIAVLRRVAETARIYYWRRVFGWRVGRGVRVHWTVHLPRKTHVILEDRAVIGANVRVISERPDGRLHLGSDSNIAQYALIDVTGQLVIGKGVTISDSAFIYTHSHGRDPKSCARAHLLEIGDKAWIGARAVVLSSARRIGARAIIGVNQVARRPVRDGEVIMMNGDDASAGINSLTQQSVI